MLRANDESDQIVGRGLLFSMPLARLLKSGKPKYDKGFRKQGLSSLTGRKIIGLE